MARDNTGVCECPIGFYGSRCEIPVNYCITGSCYNQGTCNTGTSGFTCSCPAGKHFPTTDISYGFKIEKISNLKNSMQVSDVVHELYCVYLFNVIKEKKKKKKKIQIVRKIIKGIFA